MKFQLGHDVFGAGLSLVMSQWILSAEVPKCGPIYWAKLPGKADSSCVVHMSYSGDSLKEVIEGLVWGSIIRAIKVDTWSLDYSSHEKSLDLLSSVEEGVGEWIPRRIPNNIKSFMVPFKQKQKQVYDHFGDPISNHLQIARIWKCLFSKLAQSNKGKVFTTIAERGPRANFRTSARVRSL